MRIIGLGEYMEFSKSHPSSRNQNSKVRFSIHKNQTYENSKLKCDLFKRLILGILAT